MTKVLFTKSEVERSIKRLKYQKTWKSNKKRQAHLNFWISQWTYILENNLFFDI